MKKFKIIDTAISSFLFISLFIFCLARPDLKNVMYSYLIIGVWQVLSMIVHEVKHWFTASSGTRRIYHWISLASLILLPFGFYWVLTFIAPFMAAFYIFICYQEVYVKMQRPLALLK